MLDSLHYLKKKKSDSKFFFSPIFGIVFENQILHVFDARFCIHFFFFEDCVYYLSSKFGICCLKLYFIELYRKGWKYKWNCQAVHEL